MPMIQSSFSDTDMIVKTLAHLLLFVHQSCLTSAQKVIENGHGLAVLGAEDKIVDYAELVVDEQANLPSQVFQNLGLPANLNIFSSPYALLLRRALSQIQFVSSNFSVGLELHGSTFAWIQTANPRYLRYRSMMMRRTLQQPIPQNSFHRLGSTAVCPLTQLSIV